MASFKNIRVEITGGIGVLTVDRPKVSNAIDRETAGEIVTALAELSATLRGVLILTGAGERAFVAGADLGELRTRRRDEAFAGIGSMVARAIEDCPMPVIAAVNGAAMGGGCELALACDLRIAASHATFGQPEVGLGIIPAAGATQRLPRVIGLGRAKHMILTGDVIDAPTALAWGLVSSVVAGPELMSAAHRLAERLLARGPLALRLAKIALNASSRVGADSGFLIETLAQAICFESDEKSEGVAAFFEKRAPRFRKPPTGP